MTEEQKKLFASLSNNEPEKLQQDSRILLIDGLNTFLRAFAVISHVNSNLNHIGGLTGFLRSLGYAISTVRPTRVIVVFDGPGSSTNKRYLYPEYKANRGIKRITNWDAFDSQEEESESIKSQVVRLIQYLRCLPVDVIVIEKIEADDVIGRLCHKFDKEITIMSSDKDYLQLVNEKITVYSPTKKKFYTPKMISEEFMVSPINFLTQKIILGDTSDNVPKVKGIGIKKLLKKFPELSTNKRITLEDVLKKCKESEDPMLKDILLFERQLSINKSLMDLENPNIPDSAEDSIQRMVENPNKSFDPTEFLRLYQEDDLTNSINDPKSWLFSKFHYLSKY